MLSGKTVVLGVTGGIAAYKACELTSRLRRAGAQVYVVMTKNACEFVALAKRADVFVIAPATANIMAKLAVGLADDMLSTTALATRAPLLIAPAMNTGMWENAATRQNVETLCARGARLIGPEGGFLACGDQGAGRMSEPETIFDAIAETLARTEDMRGLRVLVTAGPTQEKIDPVRYLTNRSSGKMGYAVAQAAAEAIAAIWREQA